MGPRGALHRCKTRAYERSVTFPQHWGGGTPTCAVRSARSGQARRAGRKPRPVRRRFPERTKPGAAKRATFRTNRGRRRTHAPHHPHSWRPSLYSPVSRENVRDQGVGVHPRRRFGTRVARRRCVGAAPCGGSGDKTDESLRGHTLRRYTPIGTTVKPRWAPEGVPRVPVRLRARLPLGSCFFSCFCRGAR